MIDIYRVGKNITRLRKENNLTQDDLAEKLFVTRQALSKWENGLSYPSIDVIFELCKIFNVSFEELLLVNEEIKLDPDNPFIGHDRNFIINSIINKTIDVDVINILYLCSKKERIMILKAIKDKILDVDIELLKTRLSMQELVYLENSKGE